MQPSVELAPRPNVGGSGATRSQQRSTVGAKSQGYPISINEGCFSLYKHEPVSLGGTLVNEPNMVLLKFRRQFSCLDLGARNQTGPYKPADAILL